MPITYCIECNITGEKYYGSTESTLNIRINGHKSKLNCSSKEILLRDDYVVYTLHEYETIEEAEMKEKWYIQNKECINKNRVRVTDEEKKEYNIKQCEKYRQKNKERIREKGKEKVECEFCKVIGRKGDLKRHQRSKKCLKFQ